jgi:hypothetical protein
MRHLSAILLTAWVFVVNPLLCTGGFALHVCDAHDACQSCQTEHCPDGHGCHKDPCRVDATPHRVDLSQTNPLLSPGEAIVPALSLGTSLLAGAITPAAFLSPDTGQPASPAHGALILPLLV